MTLQLAILNVVLSVIVADSQSALEDDKEHRAKQVEDKKRSSLKSLKALLKKMDKNHDKQIAWNEFVEAWRTQPHFRSLMTILDVGEERLKEVFDMMDLDRSETINREEFLRFIQETHFCDMRMQITTMKMDLDHKWNLLLDLHDSVAVLAAEQRHTRASICSSQGMAEELPVVKAEPLAGVCSGAELRSVLSTALGAAFGGLEARLADRLEQLEAALAPPAAAPQADPSEGGSGGCAALGAALAGLEARLADRLEQLEAALARPAAPPLADALEGGAAGGGLVAEAPEKPRGGPLDAGPPAAVQVCPLQLPALPAAGAGQGDQGVCGSALAPAARAADRPAARGAAVGAGPVPAAEAQLPEASPPPRRAPPGAAAEAARPRSASPRPGQAWAGAAGIGAPHETGGQDTPNAWHPQARSPSSPAAFDASFAWSPVPGGLNASGPWQRVSASMQASLLAAARQHAPVRAPLLPPLSLGPASASRVGVALQIAAGASAGESLPLQEVVRRMESAGIPLNAEEQQVLASSLAIGRGLC
ncbi:unnamed protein product [Prorocentrum cordatum]|uniref:EF-hand domain-containing protein n=1 Tax=Prorocentrum cordatum TaxID=2364126 RepID=A0ABN9WN75_9DINO|nr:unnamed protein product [Polarella glacialis]